MLDSTQVGYFKKMWPQYSGFPPKKTNDLLYLQHRCILTSWLIDIYIPVLRPAKHNWPGRWKFIVVRHGKNRACWVTGGPYILLSNKGSRENPWESRDDNLKPGGMLNKYRHAIDPLSALMPGRSHTGYLKRGTVVSLARASWLYNNLLWLSLELILPLLEHSNKLFDCTTTDLPSVYLKIEVKGSPETMFHSFELK